MANFDEIALMRDERGFVTGGTGSGKSTLCEYMVVDFKDRYTVRSNNKVNFNKSARVVILDSKPRFRAEFELTGLKATKRYKNWDHGTYIPGSVVGDLTQEDCGLAAAWRMGAQIVILQSGRSVDLGAMLRGAAHFFEEARHSRPQLLYVDELGDFFGTNGQPVPGLPVQWRDIILRSARAGRELGFSLLASMQRPKGVPTTVIQELTKLYLFRLDNVDDMMRLWDLGVPTSIEPPTEDHEFRFWKRRTPGSSARLLRLNVRLGDKSPKA